jgi:hypothetical protein
VRPFLKYNPRTYVATEISEQIDYRIRLRFSQSFKVQLFVIHFNVCSILAKIVGAFTTCVVHFFRTFSSLIIFYYLFEIMKNKPRSYPPAKQLQHRLFQTLSLNMAVHSHTHLVFCEMNQVPQQSQLGIVLNYVQLCSTALI